MDDAKIKNLNVWGKNDILLGHGVSCIVISDDHMHHPLDALRSLTLTEEKVK